MTRTPAHNRALVSNRKLRARMKSFLLVYDRLSAQLDDVAELLLATATQLDHGAIHPAHVANRLRKIAREMTGASK